MIFSIEDLKTGEQVKNYEVGEEIGLQRFSKRIDQQIEIILFLDKDSDLANSNKRRKLIFNTIQGLYLTFQKNNKEFFMTLYHNIDYLHAEIFHEIEGVMPREEFQKLKFDERKKKISEQISTQPEYTAEAFCNLSNRTTELNAQLEGIRILVKDDQPEKAKNVNLKELILFCIYPFYERLNHKQIKINVNINTEEKFLIHFNVVNCAIHHLVTNIEKYALKNSDIDVEIKFNSGNIEIYWNMTSYAIDEDEKDTIFLHGKTGKYNKNSNYGIGLFVAKKVLNSIKGDIRLDLDIKSRFNLNGQDYQKNSFIFILPKFKN